jgi:CBS domain-containing protein
MKVHDLMVWEAEACRSDSNLADAAMIMWRKDCGFVPVIEGSSKKLVGVITDRDVCIATATKHRDPQSIGVSEVMSRKPRTCLPTDDIRVATKAMKEGQVRRLPVTDEQGTLKGVISLNDIVLAGGRSKTAAGLTPAEVIDVIQSISTHRTETAIVPGVA